MMTDEEKQKKGRQPMITMIEKGKPISHSAADANKSKRLQPNTRLRSGNF